MEQHRFRAVQETARTLKGKRKKRNQKKGFKEAEVKMKRMQKQALKRVLMFLLTFAMLIGLVPGAALAADKEQVSPAVKVEGGLITGVSSDVAGVTVFKGIPYAAPPVGDLRWKAPQDVVPWDDVRRCDTWPNTAMQNAQTDNFWISEFYYDTDYLPAASEDCLYLNLYTPEKNLADPQGKYPVMVWIHGGANDHGYASEMEFNAAELANQGIIVVEVQYRVNIFGFLALPELTKEGNGSSGNYAMLDIVKSLEWVQENIAAFGGDPDAVTVAGQSAGASNTAALLSMPAADGLYDRVIMQSSGSLSAPSLTPLADAEAKTKAAVTTAFGEEMTLEELRALPAEKLMDPAVYSTLWNACRGNKDDGKTFRTGAPDFTGIDVMMGSCSDEMTSLGGTPTGTLDTDKFYADLKAKWGNLYDVYDADTLFAMTDPDMYDATEAYRMNMRIGGEEWLVRNRINTLKTVASGVQNLDSAYIYYFNQMLPPHDDNEIVTWDESFYGSFHSSELWYMFDSMRDDIAGQRAWTEADHALADVMSQCWANFVKTGDPGNGWQPCTYENNGGFMHFADGKATFRTELPNGRDDLYMEAEMIKQGLTEEDIGGAAEVAKDFKAGTYEGMNYRYFEPVQAKADGSYPLVLFLHSEKEAGTDNLAQLNNKGATLWAESANQAKNPAYVLAPQNPDANGWNVAQVKALLDDFVNNHPNVDKERIYIQGMSMGGTAVWEMIAAYPTTFAAAMPICGSVSAELLANTSALAALKNQPIWAFHAADDKTTAESNTSNMIAALKANGSACAKYEVYSAGSITPDAHWDLADRVYGIGTPYNWLFAQSLAKTQNGAIDPSMTFTSETISEEKGITAVWDYELGKIYVINPDKTKNAVLVDTAMGGYGKADLYGYLVENGLVSKDQTIDVVLTHNHGDHIMGLPSLAASEKLGELYIHELDAPSVVKADYIDLNNVTYIKEGDTIPTGGSELEVYEVPGHTQGSVVFFYGNDYIFTGDAIGSGDVWMTATSVEEYLPYVKRFADEVNAREAAGADFTIYTGHAENYAPFTSAYLNNMVKCAEGTVNGTITPGVYTRRNGSYATCGNANIYFNDATTNVVMNAQVETTGQKVVSIELTFPTAAEAQAAAKGKFTVTANRSAVTDELSDKNTRTVTGTTVDGTTVTLALDVNDTNAGTCYYTASTGTVRYALSYTVAQGDKTWTVQAMRDAIVDHFEKASYDYTAGGYDVDYRYFDPTENGFDANGSYPLILFLHGSGESGNNNTSQLIANKGATVWVESDHLDRNPVYVVAPQRCADMTSGWDTKAVKALLDDFIANHPNVDMDRIYIQGLSMGGMGTWKLILDYPTYFAAAIPICGRVADESYYENGGAAFDDLRYLPVWAAVAADDSEALAGGTAKAVKALQDHGNKTVKYYEYLPGSVTPNPHHSWEKVYEDEEIYNWLFEQDRERTNNGTTNASLTYTMTDLGDGVKRVLDWHVDPIWVLQDGDEVLVIDTGMGSGNLYDYLMANAIENPKTAKIDLVLTHNHGDHIAKLGDFVGKDNVEKVYIGADDSASVIKMLGADASKVVTVKDGDTIPYADHTVKVIDVPGHTAGSVVYLVDNSKLFTGDAIGTGYVWMQIGVTTIAEYVDALEHLNAAVKGLDLTIYGGHMQNRYTLTDQYVRDILECAKGIVDGSLEGVQYLRGNVTDAKIATYGTASIVYDPDKIGTQVIVGPSVDHDKDDDETDVEEPETPLNPTPDSFTDLPDNHWAMDGITYVLEEGLMNGTSSTTFSPDAQMTRAMLVTVLYRMAGEPEVSGSADFVDVADGQWYTKAVIWAQDKGIVEGIGGQRFNPEGQITREMLAEVLYRYTEASKPVSNGISNYPDGGQVSAWAVDGMNWAVAQGVIRGQGDGNLAPAKTATRAEIATILQRMTAV